MINLTTKTDQTSSTTVKLTGTNPVSADKANAAANPTASSPTTRPATSTAQAISLLEQLQQGQTLTAAVKSTQLLSQSDKSLLQQVNPSLAEELNHQLNQKSGASTLTLSKDHYYGVGTKLTTNNSGFNNNGFNNNGFNNNGFNNNNLNSTQLYLTKLWVKQSSGKPLNLTAITTQALESNEPVLLSQKNQQLIVSKQSDHTIQKAMTEAVKQHLPKQYSSNQLQQFILRLEQLPYAIKERLIHPATLNAIRSLHQFSYTDKHLSDGANVKQALHNSGIALEAKLHQQYSTQGDIRIALNKVMTEIHNSDHLNTNLKDLDKLLFTLATQAPLPTLNKPPIPAQTLPNNAAALFHLLGLTPPQKQTTPTHKVIEQHLKQLIEQTYSRIQFNQLRSLALDHTNAEYKTSILQQFHTEIPLRFNENTYTLQISLLEKEYDNSDEPKQNELEQEEKQSPKEKRWQVFMSFDLPNNEKLHTQLNLINESVSATLWAESSLLCQQAKSAMHVLRDKFLANGLSIDDLICIQGKPPSQSFDLGYSLVDIRT